MPKKFGFAAIAAAGIMLAGAPAFAAEPAYGAADNSDSQNGLINVDKVDIAHNVNVPVGLCDDAVNVLGVQVPVKLGGVANGIPILSPGSPSEGNGKAPYTCAKGTVGAADNNHG